MDADERACYVAVLNAFTGEQKYYARRWEPLLNGTSKYAGFNEAAALYGSLWFFGRKMYGLGALVVVLSGMVWVAGMYASSYLLGGVFQASAVHLAIGWLVLALCVRLPLGCMANRLYYLKARKVLAKVALTAESRADLLKKVALQGGTTGLQLWLPLTILATTGVLGLRP